MSVNRSRARAGLLLALGTAAWCTTALPAYAGDGNRAACIAAFEGAGELRSAGKLLEARRGFAQCAAESCPASLQKECANELELVNASLPSVVIAGRDQTGRDVIRGRLLIDNVDTDLAGMAMPLDPGRHTIRLEAEGCDPAEQEVFVMEAEKNRKIIVALECAAASRALGRAGSPQPLAPAPAPASPPSRVLPITLAAVGIVGLAGFAYFGLKGGGELDDIRATGCAPDCDRDAVGRARTHLVIGDVLGAVGIVAIGAAVWTWLSPRSGSTPRSQVAIGVRPAATGGTFLMTKAF